MLTNLTINNFAIIESLEVKLEDGLTVITGETGAGKSIIVDAIDFLLGARASSDLIKSGKDKAIVEGSFTLSKETSSWLKNNSFDLISNTEIVISREITAQGSKVRINGSLANVSHLISLKGLLAEIHHQNEHVELLKAEKQLEIIDWLGNDSHQALIAHYKDSYKDYKNLKDTLEKEDLSHEELIKKIDFLKYQVKEIKEANVISSSEEDELKNKRESILHKKELAENTLLSNEILNSDNKENVISLLNQIKKLYIKSSDFDKSFEPYIENLTSIIEELKEISSFNSNYLEGFSDTGETLEDIEDRLNLIYKLKKKYGGTIEEITNHGVGCEKELEILNRLNFSKEDLNKKLEEKKEITFKLAEKVSTSREEITKKFVEKINFELNALGFNHSLFVVKFTDCEINLNGKEEIQFLFTANPDEDPKPILKAISGGELSRIMLAIKSLSQKERTKKIIIFDEIDAGISGKTASIVARKLYKISRSNQVLCITHQPIVAAMADENIFIRKEIENALSTKVLIKKLNSSNMEEALICLLSPENKVKDLSQDTKQYAKSLIENAKKIKIEA